MATIDGPVATAVATKPPEYWSLPDHHPIGYVEHIESLELKGIEAAICK